MASIRIISSNTVKASNTSHTNKALTPWDLQLLLHIPIQKGLLFHLPNPNSSQQNNISSLIQHLKTSLSLTLNFFTPLAGRLAAVNHHDMINFSINSNNAGVLFVHASADAITISHLTQSTYIPTVVKSFFPLNGMKNLDGISNPLLGVQITELRDGIFIGCTMNHVVADGSSFWHFFNSWSEISRCHLGGYTHNGVLNISKLPKFSLPDGVDCIVNHIPRSSIEVTCSDDYVLPLLKERVFHFTRREIAELKSRANSEMGTNEISSLQALLTHLWRSITRCRNLDPEEEIGCKLVIGARTRWNPPLPSNYFGNAFQTGTVSLKAKELLENGIGYAAWKMNKMVALHSEAKLMTFIKEWRENPKLMTVGNLLPKNALLTSSSPRFNVYGNDFGWGKPIAVRSGGANKNDGKINIYQGIEDGSIDIEVCLSHEVFKAMENDVHFMATVSV
ncbi:HXXXD-type acyl-transferase family protein [Euphorbia peplus]|nr:HXXXD-type acyl-transferase family protein [Euphorbia peplus]